MFDVKKYKFEWMHIGILLVFLFPLFTNTLRHWASSGYVLLALLATISMRKYSLDLRKEEKIFLLIIALHVMSTAMSNILSGWTPASNSWFFSGDVRFLFAIPLYLYLRRIPEIWKWFVMAIPLGGIIIGLTGIIDFYISYSRNTGQVLAEGVYGHIFQGNIAALWSILSYAAIYYYKNDRRMRMLCIAGALLGAIGAILSVTRNAWFSLILLYALMFVLQGMPVRVIKSLGLRNLAVITVAIFVFLYLIFSIQYVKDRFFQVYEEPVMYFTADRSKPIEYRSLTYRLEQWRGVVYAFQEKPIFGHGMGNVGKAYNEYIREGRVNQLIYHEDAEKYGIPVHVHSAYFEYLGDTGIVGFIVILLVLYYASYVAYGLRHKSQYAWRFVILQGAAFGMASLTEVPFIRNNWTSAFLMTSVIFFIWLMHEVRQSEKQVGAASSF